MLRLSGLNTTRTNKYIFFSFTLLVYLSITFVNLTLIVTILLEKSLHQPLYIFVCNLCVNGLYGTAGFYPKLLADFLSDSHVISYSGCLIQVFVIYSSRLCETANLTVMAYDRYVAICMPLQYNSVMTPLLIGKLIPFAWICPLCSMIISIVLTIRLPLCGYHIEKLYCDNWSVVKLSCIPTTYNLVYGYIHILMFFAPVIYVFYSYVHIIAACRRSQKNQIKFLNTCLPHLLTFTNFIIALLFDGLYSRYGTSDMPLSLRNVMSLEFLIIPPLFNPIIYGLKLHQIRRRVYNIFRCHKIAQS
ncbi:olfactory receptor 52E4-like [Lepisosteus oculatus]|uniref:olfactory receptor 52E4-like n=1 Tax=Lepisosteus oculatus TaxID=7918 RepID=UPI0037242968